MDRNSSIDPHSVSGTANIPLVLTINPTPVFPPKAKEILEWSYRFRMAAIPVTIEN